MYGLDTQGRKWKKLNNETTEPPYVRCPNPTEPATLDSAAYVQLRQFQCSVNLLKYSPSERYVQRIILNTIRTVKITV